MNMKIEIENDNTRMQKKLTIDYRSMLDEQYCNTLLQTISNKISEQIANEYLAKHSADILSKINPEIMANLVKMTIAKKVQEDHDILMTKIDPMARSIPELNKAHNQRMKNILEG
jgi:hypothetical protein